MALTYANCGFGAKYQTEYAIWARVDSKQWVELRTALYLHRFPFLFQYR